MKTVGLVTYYGDNYGGVLQAYALQRQVKELGYDCKIISNDFLNNRTKKEKRTILLRKVKALICHPFDYLKRRKAMRLYADKRAQQNAKFSEFRSKNIDIFNTGYTTYEQYVSNPPLFDLYLCGSDQIWNPNLFHSNGFYFADFAPKGKRRVSYASSIGVSSVTEEQAKFLKPFLERLDIISTRESDGAKIVERIIDKPAQTVLDPTLLLNDVQWKEVAADRLFEQPYVFCYLFGERAYYETIKQKVKELTGMNVVSIPFVAREMADDSAKVFDAGPAEFISLIQNASLVLTDSFHATAFSVNLGVPFLSLLRFSANDKQSMNSRLYTLLSMVGLEDRIVDEKDVITSEKLFNCDFESAALLLKRRRENDAAFLKNALEND